MSSKPNIEGLMSMNASELIDLLHQLKSQLPDGAEDRINKKLHSKIMTYMENTNTTLLVCNYKCNISDVLPDLVCIDNRTTEVDLEYGAIISNEIQASYKRFKDGMTLENTFDSQAHNKAKNNRIEKFHHAIVIEVIYKIDDDNYILKASYVVNQVE